VVVWGVRGGVVWGAGWRCRGYRGGCCGVRGAVVVEGSRGGGGVGGGAVKGEQGRVL